MLLLFRTKSFVYFTKKSFFVCLSDPTCSSNTLWPVIVKFCMHNLIKWKIKKNQLINEISEYRNIEKKIRVFFQFFYNFFKLLDAGQFFGNKNFSTKWKYVFIEIIKYRPKMIFFPAWYCHSRSTKILTLDLMDKTTVANNVPS